MGDMTKFNSAIEYYIFNVLLMCLLISEIFIFFYTREYYGAAEPPVRCGESHLSGLTEPPQFVY